jgi:hypothetical protein
MEMRTYEWETAYESYKNNIYKVEICKNDEIIKTGDVR